MQRPGFKILLVDDNEAFINGLGELLAGDGHTVRVCFRGDESIAVAARFVPDLVFLDLSLPDMSGGEVARRLGEDPALSATRFISLSGSAELSPDRERGDYFSYHLAKPLQIEELERLLEKLAAGQD